MGRKGGIPIHESDTNIDLLVASPEMRARMCRLQRFHHAPVAGDVVIVFCRREAAQCRSAGWRDVTSDALPRGVRAFEVTRRRTSKTGTGDCHCNAYRCNGKTQPKSETKRKRE